ncbi:putative transporter AQR1 [Cyberlindnera fabianii]|uniref:Putative transporter AQR1 n=1 Tax=Cyberlindnera fabianii TaxID=36022 RepID=A0A1V2LBY3_CYBFA|nr:putative transporter AQR1 [Cyberlindnera fabianii]
MNKSTACEKTTTEPEATHSLTNALDSDSQSLSDDTSRSPSPSPSPPFTVLSHTEKYLLVILSASVSIWSSFGAPIYYPALQVLKKQFNISEELVNVSVVVYLAFQGIAPTVFGGLADAYGRRPVLILCLLIFIVSSIIIAITNNYALLLVFRIFQASGIAPTVAVCSGMVGDFTERHERGGFIGLQSGLTLMGQAFGALIGAGLIAGFNWRAIFWFLAIGSGVTLVVISVLLPETKRAIVGNGSIIPSRLMNRAPLLSFPSVKRRWHLDLPDVSTLEPRGKPDYLAPFKIILLPEIAICLLNGAIHFGIWTMLLTSLTHELSTNYHYSTMKIGLCYLPAGIGGLVGSLVCGRILDFVYRRRYARYEYKRQTGAISTDTPFNIVQSRILVIFPYTVITDGFTVMFGWCLYQKVHIASVLVSEFCVCMGCIAMIGINMTLLIDLYPSKSSAASSSVNLTRCLAGALFVAVLTSMNDKLTVGGTFTLMAGLGVISTVLLLVPMKYGMKWGMEREERQKRDMMKKEQELDGN